MDFDPISKHQQKLPVNAMHPMFFIRGYVMKQNSSGICISNTYFLDISVRIKKNIKMLIC